MNITGPIGPRPASSTTFEIETGASILRNQLQALPGDSAVHLLATEKLDKIAQELSELRSVVVKELATPGAKIGGTVRQEELAKV